MKIAITGGTGFIGRWLLSSIPHNYECIILGRDKNKSNYKINNRVFKYISTDYSKRNLESILSGLDAVIHLAGIRTGSSDFATYMINVYISQNIFESCIKNDIKNIVFLSTISVYSDINKYPWSEEQMVLPISFYGISKVAIENLAEYYNRTYDMNIKSLRVAQVIGYGERPGYMLMTFINQAYLKQTLNIFGKGAGRREYIYVKDVVDAIICALKKPNKKGIYNIGTGKNISHLELAKMINEVFNNEGNYRFVNTIKEDTSVLLMDNNRASLDLGWLARWSIKEGLRDIRNIMDNLDRNPIDF